MSTEDTPPAMREAALNLFNRGLWGPVGSREFMQTFLTNTTTNEQVVKDMNTDLVAAERLWSNQYSDSPEEVTNMFNLLIVRLVLGISEDVELLLSKIHKQKIMGYGQLADLWMTGMECMNNFDQERYMTFLKKFKCRMERSAIGQGEWLFWKTGLGSLLVNPEPYNVNNKFAPSVERIPRKIFYYFDQDPVPDDIMLRTINVQKEQNVLDVELYNKKTAKDFLSKVYGEHVSRLFDTLRHPAEEADFFRLHIVYHHGGYYCDCDELLDPHALIYYSSITNSKAIFPVGRYAGGVISNAVFGSIKNHPLLGKMIQLLHKNCEEHPDMDIAFKTGPGMINKAVFEFFLDRTMSNPVEHGNFSALNKDIAVTICPYLLRRVSTGWEPEYRQTWRNWSLGTWKTQQSSK